MRCLDFKQAMAISLVESQRSIGRLPKALLGSLGLAKRYSLSSRRTPETGKIFGPGGRFLLVGYTRGLSTNDCMHSGHSKVLQSRLQASEASARAEFIPLSKYLLEEKFSIFHVPLVYEFEVKLDGRSLRDPADQSIAQWHGIPNRLLGAPDRHAPFLLAIVKGRYTCISAASSRLAPKLDKTGDALSGLQRVRRIDLSDPACDTDRWVNWRFEVRWSFAGDCGWWRLYKNYNLIAEDFGPNCYNELRGAPYFQFGIYRLGRHGILAKNTEPNNERSYRNITIGML